GHALSGRVLANFDPELRCSAQHLAGDAARIRHPVAPAARGAEHVGDREPRHDRRVDPLDGHAERVMERPALLELGETGLRRRKEEIADLTEELWPEPGEEPDALTGEHDL